MSRWPVAGPSGYWLLASSPASKVRSPASKVNLAGNLTSWGPSGFPGVSKFQHTIHCSTSYQNISTLPLSMLHNDYCCRNLSKMCWVLSQNVDSSMPEKSLSVLWDVGFSQQCFWRFKSSWIWLCIIGQSKKNLLLLLILWNVSGHSMSTLWEEYISVNTESTSFWACALAYDTMS